MSKLLDSAVVAVALGVVLTVVLSLLLRMAH
jgi:hypothetical protein